MALMENAVFIVGLVLGTLLLTSVCWTYVRAPTHAFNLGGVILSTFGFLLVGLSVFQSVDISISSKGVTAKLDQLTKNVAQVQSQTEDAKQTLNNLTTKVDDIYDKLTVSSNGHLSDE